MRCWPEVTLLAALLLLLPGCDDNKTDEPAPTPAVDAGMDAEPGGEGDAGPCDDPDLTWARIGEPYVLNWCTGCHSAALEAGRRSGAPVGIDFNTEADVLRQADRFLARATGDTPTMPPVGGPTEHERTQVEAWLRCASAAE